MTPEYAAQLAIKPVNPELYEIMRDVYDRFEPHELTDVIACIRAEIVLVQEQAKLDDEIAELLAKKQALEAS
jgi:hypothetical protein